ncbi:MAG: iron-sulfur cluster-binding protein [Rhodospirillaceae bacterium]|nr:iron-sulfur cluster-binding protein [Rhodospirillaceae bacterium]
MQSTSRQFSSNARKGIADEKLQAALSKLSHGFPVKRLAAMARLPEFEALRDDAQAIKEHTLANLGTYLETYEAKVLESVGHVHWATDAAEACEIIFGVCRDVDAKTVTKGKSMISEEIAVNEYLQQNGVQPIETDLGEYIIQLRGEPPSHIIAPAIHLSKDQVEQTFREEHQDLPADRNLEEPRALLEEARAMLRRKFIAADVGVTGANMVIAETGTSIIVTNEGNGDLTQTLPKTHIVIASIEKVVPTLEDATTILRVLARSATGQEMSVYNTFSTGPRRPDDLDGPENYHVVLLDNGRSKMLGGEFHEMLRCIRCSACLNHCPVYKAIGGHAYGWVYSGPMGAVLIPGLQGLAESHDLPGASTFCGKCEDVCPMRIPLPRMLRSWREKAYTARLGSTKARFGLAAWAFLARRPVLYRPLMAIGVAVLALFGRRGRFSSLPLAGGWTSSRDLSAPEGRTFLSQWKRGKR